MQDTSSEWHRVRLENKAAESGDLVSGEVENHCSEAEPHQWFSRKLAHTVYPPLLFLQSQCGFCKLFVLEGSLFLFKKR